MSAAPVQMHRSARNRQNITKNKVLIALAQAEALATFLEALPEGANLFANGQEQAMAISTAAPTPSPEESAAKPQRPASTNTNIPASVASKYDLSAKLVFGGAALGA